MSCRIMVMGVGNVLMSDEGLGVHFLKQLTDLPPGIEVVDGGTLGLELVSLIQDTEYLILVDAVNAQSEPGAIFRFAPGDLKVFPEQFEVSFHQVGIIEVLTMAKIMGHAPQTIIYGVQPKTLEWGLDLSPEIEAAFPKLKQLVLKEIDYILQHNEIADINVIQSF